MLRLTSSWGRVRWDALPTGPPADPSQLGRLNVQPDALNYGTTHPLTGKSPPFDDPRFSTITSFWICGILVN